MAYRLRKKGSVQESVRKAAEDQVGLEERLDEFLAKMREARQRADSWQVHGDGFAAIEGGLVKTYRRGRKALRAAYEAPGTESFHEWRKRVKYHWYHVRLLQDVWSEMMEVREEAAHDLSDLLGDDHDLAVLRETLLAEPEAFGSERDVQAFIGLIDRRRAELQAAARPLGERVFAEKPKRLAARLGSYWQTWKNRGKLQPCLEDEPVAAGA